MEIVPSVYRKGKVVRIRLLKIAQGAGNSKALPFLFL
jgi:hypothetical protein